MIPKGATHYRDYDEDREFYKFAGKSWRFYSRARGCWRDVSTWFEPHRVISLSASDREQAIERAFDLLESYPSNSDLMVNAKSFVGHLYDAGLLKV